VTVAVFVSVPVTVSVSTGSVTVAVVVAVTVVAAEPVELVVDVVDVPQSESLVKQYDDAGCAPAVNATANPTGRTQATANAARNAVLNIGIPVPSGLFRHQFVTFSLSLVWRWQQ
jgi:hypothetical protein